MTAASIQPPRDPKAQYLLRVGDTCLVLAQRLSEWCGHAPVLEEDIALANHALDLLGQARGLLTRAGQLGPVTLDEDQLAFLRRCGFDAFAPEAALDPVDADAAFGRYGEVYQPTVDGRAPIWAKRHG